MPGAVIYKGRSLIDDGPIAAIAVWGSTNRKTGDLLQVYILRTDMHPIDANRTGADTSICGACPLKGTPTDRDSGQAALRECYVTLAQGPSVVFKTLQAGRYDDATSADRQAAVGAGRRIRIGAYGDGAAVPPIVWVNLLQHSLGHTAYSHTRGLAHPDLYTASVETLDQARDAWADGYRTFRVVKDRSDLQPNEIVCPNETKGVQCRDCMLCSGARTSAKSIVITAHGTGKVHFLKRIS